MSASVRPSESYSIDFSNPHELGVYFELAGFQDLKFEVIKPNDPKGPDIIIRVSAEIMAPDDDRGEFCPICFDWFPVGTHSPTGPKEGE